MSSDVEKWQWVDEDPFEKLLTGRHDAIEADSRLQLEPSVPVPAASISSDAGPRLVDSQSARFPTDASVAAFDLAVSLEKLEHWEAAANSFRKALDVEPGRVEALLGLGACLLHLDSAGEALTCFEDCLYLDAERERALLGKAVALQKLERHEDADRTYRELLQIAPNAVEPLANLVALSVERQDAVAVGEYSRRLLRLDPYSKAALQGLATLAIWNGDQAAAVDYCTRLVEVDPVSFEGWSNLGYAKQSMLPLKQVVRSIA